jgi:hypothetical protein
MRCSYLYRVVWFGKGSFSQAFKMSTVGLFQYATIAESCHLKNLARPQASSLQIHAAASAYGSTPSRSANEALVGSPKRVAAQMALLRDAGARNLM